IGVVILVLGQLSAWRAMGQVPLPKWVLFEAVSCVASAALLLWGWYRLRRAKTAQPDLSWPQFLHHDLIAIGVFTALMGIWFVMPHEFRQGLMQWLQECSDQLHKLHMSKGGQ